MLAREAEKDRDGTIEPHHVAVGQAADASAQFGFRDGRHLIRHDARGRSKTIRLTGRHCDAKQRQIRRVRREGTDGYGIESIERIILENHNWP